MAERLEPIELNSSPNLAHLVDEVVATRRPRRLQRDGMDVATITPARRQRGARTALTALRHDDALWQIVGLIGTDDGPTDISSNKHRYLSEAYTPKRR